MTPGVNPCTNQVLWWHQSVSICSSMVTNVPSGTDYIVHWGGGAIRWGESVTPAIQLCCKTKHSVNNLDLKSLKGPYAEGCHEQVALFGGPLGHRIQRKGMRSLNFCSKVASGTLAPSPFSAILPPGYHNPPWVLLCPTPDVCCLS